MKNRRSVSRLEPRTHEDVAAQVCKAFTDLPSFLGDYVCKALPARLLTDDAIADFTVLAREGIDAARVARLLVELACELTYFDLDPRTTRALTDGGQCTLRDGTVLELEDQERVFRQAAELYPQVPELLPLGLRCTPTIQDEHDLRVAAESVEGESRGQAAVALLGRIAAWHRERRGVAITFELEDAEWAWHTARPFVADIVPAALIERATGIAALPRRALVKSQPDSQIGRNGKKRAQVLPLGSPSK